MCVFSQSVLIDNKGDTLVTITLQQMDKIYIELLQKDSLMAQSEISRFKTLKYVQLLDSADKDINTLKLSANSLKEYNTSLLKASAVQQEKIKRNRKIAFVSICVAILELLVIIP